MRTPVGDDGRRGIGSLDSRQNTPPPDHDQERAAAEEALAESCRAMLRAGFSPGMISVHFGRCMQQLLEAADE